MKSKLKITSARNLGKGLEVFSFKNTKFGAENISIAGKFWAKIKFCSCMSESYNFLPLPQFL